MATKPSVATSLQYSIFLFYEASDGDLWKHLWATLRRVVICFFVAMALGGLLGSWMGISRRVNAWLDMWLIVLLNIPALVTIVLCYLWLGLIEAAALTAVIINKVPNVAVIFREGVRSFNSRYLDLSKSLSTIRLAPVLVCLGPTVGPLYDSSSPIGTFTDLENCFGS